VGAKDSELIDMLIEGRKSAFEQLYCNYSNRVFSLSFFLLKDTGWSEDTVQEVFLKLWQTRADLRRDQNLWAYLYVLTKRHAFNKLRSVKRSNACFERLWAQFSEPTENPHDAVAAKELRDRINKLLGLLPAQQRMAFSLSRLEGFSHQEIAEHLNISPHTVKNHIVQAVKNLKNNRLLPDFFMAAVFLLT
jgi:RNA polymerase sigma-70 factor (family 1)